MIKINLLLARKEKKKIGLKKELIISIVSIVLLFLILGGIQWKLSRDQEEISLMISNAKKEIAHYKSLTTEVSKAKEDQKVLQDKLNVIHSLRKEKTGPARVLEEISLQKPEKIQLESMKKEGAKLGIEGIALVSEQSEQSRIKLKKFTLSCEISFM
jgi:Tfp pilus assembly protein PilN